MMFVSFPLIFLSLSLSLSLSLCLSLVLSLSISLTLPCQHGQPSPDLHTPLKSSSLANIRVAFGPSLSRELVELQCSEAEELLDKPPAAGEEQQDDFGVYERERERERETPARPSTCSNCPIGASIPPSLPRNGKALHQAFRAGSYLVVPCPCVYVSCMASVAAFFFGLSCVFVLRGIGGKEGGLVGERKFH